MSRVVGVRELRQHLSRYLVHVKDGESFVVTEHGREVARLIPSGAPDSPLGRLVVDRGASMPQGSLLDVSWPSPPPPGAPSSEQVLDELREDRA